MPASASSTVCNTVPTSQHSYTIRPDWITLRILTPEPGQPEATIAVISQALNDSFEFLPGPHPMPAHNTTYDAMAVSVKGIRAYWHNPGNGLKSMGGFSATRVEFAGHICGAASSVDLRDLCQLLSNDHQAVCTRFDIALDDYTKQLWTWEELADAARSGNYSGPKSYSIIESAKRGETAGLTHYFGTRKSESFYRFYDKSVESGGEVDANRMEVEFKRSKAHQAFIAWLNPPIGSELDAAQILTEFVMGNICFLDRSTGEKNLDRLTVLPWWQAMRDLLANGVKLTPIRAVATIEKTCEWLEKRVFPSMYAVCRAVGEQSFESLMKAWIEWGKQHQNRRHNAMVTAAQLEGWG